MKSIARIAVMMLMVVGANATAAELAAQLHWYQSLVLGFPVSGVVRTVAVEVGDKVQQGDVLIQLDGRLPQAQLAALQAAVKAGENNLAEAQRELDRTQEMYDQTLLADHDLQMAHIAQENALAQYNTAQAELARAELELEYTALRAPYAGVVVERQAAPGQFVNVNQANSVYLRLAETGRMLARSVGKAGQGDVPPLGQKVEVKVTGSRFEAKVIRITATDNGAVIIDALFDTGGKALLPGQAASIVY